MTHRPPGVHLPSGARVKRGFKCSFRVPFQNGSSERQIPESTDSFKFPGQEVTQDPSSCDLSFLLIYFY